MIRRARPEDKFAIGGIAKRAYHVYVDSLDKPPAPMAADFERHIDDDWVFVFERDGDIAGYAILITMDGRALLDNIAVDPDRQRRGIGRALLERVEDEAAVLGHRYLELYTNVIMTENLRWYEQLGFVETRRAVEDGFHRIYMRKNIGPKS